MVISKNNNYIIYINILVIILKYIDMMILKYWFLLLVVICLYNYVWF